MKFVQYMDCISPHQVPLARELSALYGTDSFRYVYRDREQADRVKLGWKMSADAPWFVWLGEGDDAKRTVREADVLLTGMRDAELIESRLKQGLTTFYTSERWFKPIILFSFHWFGNTVLMTIPGWVRLFRPSYFKMARRFARMFENGCYGYLPVGPWAEKDMRLVCKLFHVKIDAEGILPWGYFVEKSDGVRKEEIDASGRSLRVLWIGRMLPLKRVDTVIKAVKKLKGSGIELTVVGDGPERKWLEKQAQGCAYIRFKPSVSIDHVRDEMRAADVLVFTSCGYDGWGAVVSEALEEEVTVLGTVDTGASATLLPKECVFRCGDWRELVRKLKKMSRTLHKSSMPIEYTAEGAAARLQALCERM